MQTPCPRNTLRTLEVGKKNILGTKRNPISFSGYRKFSLKLAKVLKWDLIGLCVSKIIFLAQNARVLNNDLLNYFEQIEIFSFDIL